MSRKFRSIARRVQRGFGAVAAIVILVILATLAGFIATLSSSQQVGSALDVQGTQAYLAAHAGIEWGKYQTKSGSCAGTTTLTLNPYTVVVTCSVSNTGSAVEVGLGSIYAITSTACNSTSCPSSAPGALYVERRLATLVER